MFTPVRDANEATAMGLPAPTYTPWGTEVIEAPAELVTPIVSPNSPSAMTSDPRRTVWRDAEKVFETRALDPVLEPIISKDTPYVFGSERVRTTTLSDR